MSKKKSKKKTGRNAPAKKKGGTSLRAALVISGIITVVAIVFFATRPQTDNSRISGQLLETRPVASASRYSGRIASAYRKAAEIPEIVDMQFCYCYCKKNFGHKTLLTCFTNEHGSMCDTCMNEVFRSYELHKKGVPKNRIKEAIDAEFGKTRRS